MEEMKEAGYWLVGLDERAETRHTDVDFKVPVGLREQDLKIRSNTKAIAFPRQIAMYLVKQLTQASLPEIGRQFGGKHHTTVLHSINKIDALRRSDKDLNRTINKLMDSFS